MDTEIYYNPRCSKCRQTLALIRGRGVEPTVIKYLENPPSREKLAGMVKQLGLDPRDLLRFKEAAARELGLSVKDDRSHDAWIDILVENPGLMERPIVVRGGRAVLARTPEAVLDLL